MSLEEIKRLMMEGRRFSWRFECYGFECWHEDGKFLWKHGPFAGEIDVLFDHPEIFELIEENKMDTREAMQALLDGKTLIDEDGDEVALSEGSVVLYDSYRNRSSCIHLDACTVKKDWRNEVSEENPILCRVGCREGRFEYLAIIIGFDPQAKSPYKGIGRACWKYAKPVKPEECYGYKD